MFVPCSSVVLAVFNCDSTIDDKAAYMFADYTSKCYSPRHRMWTYYAAVFVFVYPIGIPCMYFALLYRYREWVNPILPQTQNRAIMKECPSDVELAINIRSKNQNLAPLAFLFASYEPEFWYWEVGLCFDRLLCTNINIFLPSAPLLRPFLLMAIGLFNVKLYSYNDPYIEDSDDLFAEVAQWNVVILLMFALMLQVDAVSPSSGMGVFLIVIVLMTALYFAYLVLRTLGTDIDYFAGLSPITQRYCKKLLKKRESGNTSFIELNLPQNHEVEEREFPLPKILDIEEQEHLEIDASPPLKDGAVSGQEHLESGVGTTFRTDDTKDDEVLGQESHKILPTPPPKHDKSEDRFGIALHTPKDENVQEQQRLESGVGTTATSYDTKDDEVRGQESHEIELTPPQKHDESQEHFGIALHPPKDDNAHEQQRLESGGGY